MTPKIIAVDIDGVICDLHPVWLKKYNADYGDDLRVCEIRNWNIHEFVLPSCGGKIYRYIENPAIYDECGYISGSKRATKFLRDHGFHIVYLTTVAPGTEGRKRQWLMDNGFFKLDDDYVETKESKSSFIADYMIDDSPANLEGFAGKKILFGRAWNKNSGFPSFKGWKKVIDYIRWDSSITF